jgi:hypothetical protein
MKDESVRSLFKLLISYKQNIFSLLLQFYNDGKEEDIDKFIGFKKSLDNLAIINLGEDDKKVNLFRDSNLGTKTLLSYIEQK